MKYKMILNTLGKILSVEALLLLLPLVTSLIYGEKCVTAFIITVLLTGIIGLCLSKFFKPGDQIIYAREGFVLVSFAWILMSAFGALPFVISGEIPSFADAFFETVSGFTTTGASVVDNVEQLSRGILFWRSFTHWVGGMGVLVFIMALVPNISDRSIHIMRAEVPGPIVGKLVPKIKDTAKILYLIYLGLTLLETVFLLFGGMPLFESLVHSFGTAGTGGFGIKGDSIGSYSPYIQWVIAIFMFLFGINFNLYFFILARKISTALKSVELWVYVAINAVSVALLTVNIFSLYGSLSDAVRHAAFQTASIVTTTGYSTADFNAWPGFSRTLILILMFCGGCAGSTAGGLKVSRVMLLFKNVGKELKKLTHPRAVCSVRLEGKPVDEQTLSNTAAYFSLYMICLISVFFLVSLFDQTAGIESNFSAAVSCFNNIGPGLDKIGPMSSYSLYSDASKYILSAAMLFGRLEIFPLFLTFLPSTWRKK